MQHRLVDVEVEVDVGVVAVAEALVMVEAAADVEAIAGVAKVALVSRETATTAEAADIPSVTARLRQWKTRPMVNRGFGSARGINRKFFDLRVCHNKYQLTIWLKRSGVWKERVCEQIVSARARYCAILARC